MDYGKHIFMVCQGHLTPAPLWWLPETLESRRFLWPLDKGLLISDYSIRTKCRNPRPSHLPPPIHAAPPRTIRDPVLTMPPIPFLHISPFLDLGRGREFIGLLF
ncbi:hypothetical protein AVEN_235127-1 [Araneus ventricosus]|uniref:Uncharacterized protein n=1 Tax=Araneus ventricosus TaxID=182803 RepID=A0A4Y2UF53_ARAVE|nr:hypothetical protein AVEN_239738-1 [Araneus ventricosus]GBO11347.1 hypothetical protein AVEN_235127-1 [Araneus ventricosus]